MKDLVDTLKDMGYSEVRTYIQSGNALFCSKKKCTKKTTGEIGARISKIHGFEPKILLLSLSELKAAADNNPFDIADGKFVHFFFLDNNPENPDYKKLKQLKTESETYKLKGTVFYLHAPQGIGRSNLAAAVEKSLGVAGTGRNLNTVRKLLAMANV